ncbi:MAG: hemerythrin family protein [Planctomycetota bacterium]|nr:hemerythrin family protein [Planctomycetota bacterium]MCX8040059.1 hemerythrin family protein [Planctomycetota bacterium]MDW8373853.1 hemerythrin family protein [Planctomycetota bacterium]
MSRFVWTADLAIDGSQIDFQHRQLLEAMADLDEALLAGQPQRVAEVVSFLHLYAETHFADEERVLALIAWPGLERHRQLHAAFRARLGELDRCCRWGDRQAARALLAFLEDWLLGHIRGADREFAAEVRALRQRQQPGQTAGT